MIITDTMLVRRTKSFVVPADNKIVRISWKLYPVDRKPLIAAMTVFANFLVKPATKLTVTRIAIRKPTLVLPSVKRFAAVKLASNWKTRLKTFVDTSVAMLDALPAKSMLTLRNINASFNHRNENATKRNEQRNVKEPKRRIVWLTWKWRMIRMR